MNLVHEVYVLCMYKSGIFLQERKSDVRREGNYYNLINILNEDRSLDGIFASSPVLK